MTVPFERVDLPPETFPFTIEYLSHASGEVLGSQVVTGPGELQVRGQNHWGEPVDVRVTLPNGNTIVERYSAD